MKPKPTVIEKGKLDKDVFSNCCSAPMSRDHSICPDCKENCVPVEEPKRNNADMKKKKTELEIEMDTINDSIKFASDELEAWIKFRKMALKRLKKLESEKSYES